MLRTKPQRRSRCLKIDFTCLLRDEVKTNRGTVVTFCCCYSIALSTNLYFRYSRGYFPMSLESMLHTSAQVHCRKVTMFSNQSLFLWIEDRLLHLLQRNEIGYNILECHGRASVSHTIKILRTKCVVTYH